MTNRVNIAQYLSLDTSISDHFSFQNLPELGIEENVICFWEGDQVSFTVAIDEQPPFKTHDEHWAVLDSSLTSEFDHIETIDSNTYTTNKNVPVSYKVYRAGEPDDSSLLIYHLISHPKASYWVIGSLLFCSEPECVNDIIIALMETAKLR
ncbi:hypothetical protein [Marinagarivorans algicola]|uniref:hypothetical protein n=1 Tax=Marinagarivorans algicola TaxID=1513270 RepID=UPI0006B4232A|nr:hypothetical protein [Marinagarivorans algicola]